MFKIIVKDIRYIITMFFLVIFILLSMVLPKKYFNKIEFLKPNSFIPSIEAKTFDMRQKFISKYRNVSDDIVIINIGNRSFEYMTDYVGAWPMPRSIYVDIINFIEAYKPKALAIDVSFWGSWKKSPKDDENLSNLFLKYDNLFTGIFFDDYSIQKRKPINLPKKHSSDLKIASDTFEPHNAANFRLSYKSMLEKGRLGVTNFTDYNDSVIRSLPMFISYPVYNDNLSIDTKKYYPNMGLKVISKIMNYDDSYFETDKNNNLIIGDRKIPMLENSEVILNWYKKEIPNKSNEYTSFFKRISFKDLFVSMQNVKKGKAPIIDTNLLKDKIIFLGYSASGFYDFKSAPTEKFMPDVEFYGVFVNNFLDNSFIKKMDNKQTVILSLLLLMICYSLFCFVKSSARTILLFLFIELVLVTFSYFIMFYSNYYLSVILPSIAILTALIGAFYLKYLLKSRDYDLLYKVANVDELTGLYNKRFFNKQMEMNIRYSIVYKKKFSLIMTDIDHFKKFNDTYGHLSGDRVLKQVAKVLADETEGKGIVCRYGGEEMCIILPHTEEEEARKTAQNLCNKIAETEFLLENDIKTHVTISLGVGVYPDNATTTIKLIEYSDKGLYWAKEHGRNQVGISEI